MPMPDEPWRNRLRPASFRGAAFKVDVSGFVAGRRTVVHEYPNRDTPSTEDMGRRARRYAIAAHIVGGDYDRARDQLIQALETQGPGTLVHPHLGELQVNVEPPFNVTERADRGRMCEIEVTFVEHGEDADASPTADTTSQAASATDAASAANLQEMPQENNAGFGSVPSGGFLNSGPATNLGYGALPSFGNAGT